jgi:hypothetical protein
MNMAWKGLVPLGVGNLTGLIIVLTLDLPRWWMLGISIGLVLAAGCLSVFMARKPQLNNSQSKNSQAGGSQPSRSSAALTV